MHTFKHEYIHLRVEGIEPIRRVGTNDANHCTIPLHNSFIVSYFARPLKITMSVTNYHMDLKLHKQNRTAIAFY